MKKITLFKKILVVILVAIGLPIIFIKGFMFFNINNAVASKDYLRVVFLLKMGADPNKAYEDFTPLLFAVTEEGNLKIIEALIKAGANVNAVTKYGASPITYAVQEGRKDIVQLLINNGAKLDPFLLYSASSDGRPEIVKILLNAGLSPKQVFLGGATALHGAAQGFRKDTEVAKILLERGADVNAKEACGYTPLHSAAVHGSKHMVILLLENGADPKLRDIHGLLPSDVARGRNRIEIQGIIDNYRKHN